MNAIELFVILLASWRLAKLFSDTTEGGPNNIINDIRFHAGVQFTMDGEPYGTNKFSAGLLCIKCNSFWFGLLFAFGMHLVPDITFWVALPFALSGAVMQLEDKYDL